MASLYRAINTGSTFCGAQAQYGSDAIAGVMNFQLKDARSGGSLEFRTGAYLDANPGSLSTCGEGIIGDIKHSCNGIGGRGQAFTVAANAGLPLGRTGFVNLSLEYGNAGPTNSSIQRTDAQNIIEAGNTNLRNPAQVELYNIKATGCVARLSDCPR